MPSRVFPALFFALRLKRLATPAIKRLSTPFSLVKLNTYHFTIDKMVTQNMIKLGNDVEEKFYYKLNYQLSILNIFLSKFHIFCGRIFQK